MIPAVDPQVQDRARLHAALGDPVRLAIVQSLLLSDLTPHETGAALGVRSNLLAHHLNVLEDVGLVLRTRSEGDGRRRYLRVDRRRLDGLVRPRPVRASQVLFVCTRNAARSQLAVALWSSMSAVPAQSAGADPAPAVAQGAVAAARVHGLGPLGDRPRGLEEVTGAPDLVISLCDRANESAGLAPGPQRLHWSIPDPVLAGDRRAFDRTVGELRGWIRTLAAALDAGA